MAKNVSSPVSRLQAKTYGVLMPELVPKVRTEARDFDERVYFSDTIKEPTRS